MRRALASLPRRLFAFAAGVALVALLASGAISRRPGALAQASNFALGTPSCNATPGLIPVVNTSSATNPLSTLAIQIVPPAGPSFGPTQINGVIGGSYSVAGSATIVLEVGPGATTSPPITSTTLPNGQHLALTSTANYLAPNAQIFLYDSIGGNVLSSATCGQSTAAAQRTFFVATNGSDSIGGLPNTQCSPETPTAGFPGSSTSGGPCLTIQNALQYARDGDTIQVDAGIYEVCSTITVSKLVKITANGSRAILHSFTGDTVFRVTAVGAAPSSGPGAPVGGTGVGASPGAAVTGTFSQFAQIDGLAIGGATNPGAAAIVLDNDAYTAITNNVLGGDPIANPQFTCANGKPQPLLNPAKAAPEPFGNAEGIILANSDHPFIANNDILGAAIFSFSPVLATGQVLTGFGIVTQECLGLGPDASDAVTVLNNLIARNVNAGIWLCSDGGGLHQIRNNVLRNNGRGMVLRAIDSATIDANTITGDYQDGIVIYDAANNNVITNNTIESHQTPGAAGIRLGDFGGGLFPLATTIGGNTLLRNWVDIVIAGARNTQLYGNTITADRDRTGILLQVGSQGAPAYTQPSGTVIGVAGQPPNKIISNGQCGATAGCAIRLDQGVTANVDATGSGGAAGGGASPSPNNFGLPPGADVNTVLWHKPNDPSLGLINTGSNIVTPAPTPSPTPTATPGASPTASSTATPTPTPGS